MTETANIIPAAHFHTVVNALHESALSATRRAVGADNDESREAARSVSAQRLSAFYSVMANAEIDAHGYYSCGAYRVPATLSAYVRDALALPADMATIAQRVAASEKLVRGSLSSPFGSDELATCLQAMVNVGEVRVTICADASAVYSLPI